MKHDMQRCPNCGAYVMSSDDFCPRCDHRLDEVPPDAVSLPDSPTEIEQSVVSGDADPIMEMDQPVGDVPEESPAESDDDLDRADRIPDVIEEVKVAEPDAARAIEIVPDSTTADERPPRLPGLFAKAVPIFANAEGDTDAVDIAPPTKEDHVAADEADIESDGDPLTDAESDLMDMTHPAIRLQSRRYIVPPAPYTPPPAPPAYAAMPLSHTSPPIQNTNPARVFVQQRVDEYRRSGYRLRSHHPDEAVLSYGKRLGVGGWFLALVSVIGFLWYVLLLALSGFQSDSVFIVLESDGYVYEDGSGAAHVRRQRSRVGRRWATFGLLIFFVCLLLAIVLGIVAGIILTQDRYQAALREAYPAVTLFEERFSAAESIPADVQTAKDGAVVFSILAGIAVIGLWGGATLFVIGTIHAGAYQVRVKALPGWD